MLSAANMLLKLGRLEEAKARYTTLLGRPRLEGSMRRKCEEKLRDPRFQSGSARNPGEGKAAATAAQDAKDEAQGAWTHPPTAASIDEGYLSSGHYRVTRSHSVPRDDPRGESSPAAASAAPCTPPPRTTVMSIFGLPDLPKFGEEQKQWEAQESARHNTS